MQKKYVLWLDESGDFAHEAEMRKKNLKPSLIGGILLEKKMERKIPFSELIQENKEHATELRSNEKLSYVLPALQRLKSEYGAHEVFFENSEYEEGKNNRQLYLRMMAEGLLQLLQTLNAEQESVSLEVLIAQRQDKYCDKRIQDERINEKEYKAMLKQIIQEKKKEHKIMLHEDTTCNYELRPAYLEPRLQLADFACNTRLTRDSHTFRDVRAEVEALYESEYIFSLSELTSENYIKRCLTQGAFSRAIFELYTSRDQLDMEKEETRILKRMSKMSYRLVKSQFKKLASDITAYIALQDDYEIGERLLKRFYLEFVSRAKQENIACDDLAYVILLQLIDMYLREGDISEARKAMNECEKIQDEMGNSLEDVFTYYQLLEKKAVLLIDEFAYQEAEEMMRDVCHVYESLMELLLKTDILKKRFPNMKSEYYGDSLCMRIYALMFLQRETPALYEEMCELSDIALRQYPDEKGELERHRQYRSHIEMENGNYEDALRWLIQAKEYEWIEDISEEKIKSFLEDISDTEVEISAWYYLMYYVLIMSEAKRNHKPFADTMWRALYKHRALLDSVHMFKEPDESDGRIELSDELERKEDSKINYHPLEIIYWKLASFFMYGKNYKVAYSLFARAERVCYGMKNYYTAYVTGFGVTAEKLCCMKKMEDDAHLQREYETFIQRMKEFSHNELMPSTKKLVDEICKFSVEQDLKATELDNLMLASRKVTY